MTTYRYVETEKLTIAYLELNPEGEKTAVLVHGWPDSPESWKGVTPALVQAGYRILMPTLRGFAPTRFNDPSTPRSGQLSSLGRDLLDFLDALNLESPALIGHDWGARAVANACGLREGAGSHLVMLAVGYGTNDPNQPLSLAQARNYWYHWFMATPRGEDFVRNKKAEFAQIMWDTWSPKGWYSQADFDEAKKAFDGDGWADVVLHSYQHRWGFADADPAYDQDEQRLIPAPVLSVPTLVLHGAADSCNYLETSEGRESFFQGPYERQVLDGVGHFPHREAPQRVADAILRFLQSH